MVHSSIQTVIDWLKKSKFKNINILDVTKTTVEEQELKLDDVRVST